MMRKERGGKDGKVKQVKKTHKKNSVIKYIAQVEFTPKWDPGFQRTKLAGVSFSKPTPFEKDYLFQLTEQLSFGKALASSELRLLRLQEMLVIEDLPRKRKQAQEKAGKGLNRVPLKKERLTTKRKYYSRGYKVVFLRGGSLQVLKETCLTASNNKPLKPLADWSTLRLPGVCFFKS